MEKSISAIVDEIVEMFLPFCEHVAIDVHTGAFNQFDVGTDFIALPKAHQIANDHMFLVHFNGHSIANDRRVVRHVFSATFQIVSAFGVHIVGEYAKGKDKSNQTAADIKLKRRMIN